MFDTTKGAGAGSNRPRPPSRFAVDRTIGRPASVARRRRPGGAGLDGLLELAGGLGGVGGDAGRRAGRAAAGEVAAGDGPAAGGVTGWVSPATLIRLTFSSRPAWKSGCCSSWAILTWPVSLLSIEAAFIRSSKSVVIASLSFTSNICVVQRVAGRSGRSRLPVRPGMNSSRFMMIQASSLTWIGPVKSPSLGLWAGLVSLGSPSTSWAKAASETFRG